MVNIFDVSGFLHANRKGVSAYGLNTSGLELLLHRVSSSLGPCVLVLDKKDNNKFDKTNSSNDSGYKSNRDGKAVEIEIMEDFLLTYIEGPGVYIYRAFGEYEADDLIYTVAKKFAYDGKQEVIVHADDIDMCACIFNDRVKVVPITSHAPERTFNNYNSMVKRGMYVPHNCVAAHIIEYGKASDNIKSRPELANFTNKVYQYFSKNNTALPIASEFVTLSDAIMDIYADDMNAMDIALTSAEMACCRYVPELSTDNIKLVALKSGKVFYTAFATIGSNKRPQNYTVIDDALKDEMTRFFEERGKSSLPNDVSEYDIGLPQVPEEVDLSDLDFSFDELEESDVFS